MEQCKLSIEKSPFELIRTIKPQFEVRFLILFTLIKLQIINHIIKQQKYIFKEKRF